MAQPRSAYAGIEQRWLIIESDAAIGRTDKTFEKNLERVERELRKELKVTKRSYHCEEAALEAVEAFGKRLKLHELSNIKVVAKTDLKAGRPTADTPFELRFHLSAELTRLPEAVASSRSRASRFILATNLLDKSLSNDELLALYKDQQVVQRGCRFKDPLFFTSSVFLKTPERVASLAMIMALSLLVYTLGQRMIRHNLATNKESVPDQKGKPTSRPTLRWVFQMFMAVHLLKVAGEVIITNLSDERKHVLAFVAPACRKYYLLL